jgi:alkanesulfonate monooxygenase SsuD/methylene tetrahydromethanopterin reductase-like flavin-dependent oxidoreductase (luciferase family)
MTTGKTPEDLRRSLETIRGYASEAGRPLPTSFEVALYYNINVNEDRRAALAESKRFLDSYYGVDYHTDFLNLWVAMGSPAECVESIRRYVDAGATTITLRLTGYDQKHQFRRVTDEVLPALL